MKVKGTRPPSCKPLSSSKAPTRTYKQVSQLRPFRERESLLCLWKHQKSVFPGGMYSWKQESPGRTCCLWKVKHATAHNRGLWFWIASLSIWNSINSEVCLSLGKTVLVWASTTLDLSREDKTWLACIKFGSAAEVVTSRKHWMILHVCSVAFVSCLLLTLGRRW